MVPPTYKTPKRSYQRLKFFGQKDAKDEMQEILSSCDYVTQHNASPDTAEPTHMFRRQMSGEGVPAAEKGSTRVIPKAVLSPTK